MFGFLRRQPEQASEPDFMRLSPDLWISTDVMNWVEHVFGHKTYNHCFKTISGPRLLNLDEVELARLGVDKIGPRKKLFREIQLIKSAPNTLKLPRHAEICKEEDSDDSGSSYAPGPVQQSTQMIYAFEHRLSLPETKPVAKPIQGCYSSDLPQLSPPRMPGVSSSTPRSQPSSPTITRQDHNSNDASPRCYGDPLQWTAADVALWLGTLNLGEYQSCLIAEKLDGSRLMALTELDMHNYGIEKIGPRKKLTKALRELKSANLSPSEDTETTKQDDTN